MQHSLVSVFTPSLMSAEDLEHIFVQREPLAQDLIRRIVDSTKGRGKEHSLLIGMRGMGKTHLVSLIYHRVKAMPELQDKLLIAWLREEEWGVDSWLDLVMRIFRAIAEDRGSADSGMAQDLLDRFYQEGFERAKGSATKFLRDLIGKRTLLLIIENMDDLFQGLGETGQQYFRAFLQEYRCCTVLATTPAIFKDVTSREMPFFGFFHPSYLESIEVDEAVKMLGQIASLNTVRDDHHDLAAFLQSAQGRARVRAVHHLAGGNPRVYTLFAQFMTRESLDDLVDAFMKMLDDLTPYYQARMKELSNQQRKIVELLVDRRQAVMVKDIAETCFIDQRAVASQLRELKKKGYVVANEVGRESFYELREVLMRFCMEVKKFRGRWVELIVDFLKIWYRPDQREEVLEKLGSNKLIFSDIKLTSYDDFKQDFVNDDPLQSICIESFRQSLKKENKLLALQIAEELYSINLIAELEHRKFLGLISREKYHEVLQILNIPISDRTKHYEEIFWQILFKEALFFIDQKEWEDAFMCFNEILKVHSNYYDVWDNRGYCLFELGRYEDAVKSFDKAIEIKPDYHKAWYNRGYCLVLLNKYEDAVGSFDGAIKTNPDYEPWNRRIRQIYPPQHACASLQSGIKIGSEIYEIWNNRGYALDKLGRYEEAIISFDHSVAIDSKRSEAWINKGGTYKRWGKYSESINCYDQVISIDTHHFSSWHIKGLIQFITHDYQSALATWQKSFQVIHEYSNWGTNNTSLLIEDFVEELIPRFTQPPIQQTLLIPLLTIYKEANVITELGAALVNTLHLIIAPTISDHTANQWLSLWRTSSLGQEPAMELPLRLMNTAIEYKKDPSKRQRLWLNLPSEERPILDKALKLAD